MTAQSLSAFFKSKRYLAVIIVVLVASGCGPQDYQKPIQQFSQASAVVITSTESYLRNMNKIEQDAAVQQAAFEAGPLDLQQISAISVITPDEIELRVKALDALSQYTANIASLAQGQAGTAVGKDTQTLSSDLKKLSTDAGKMPALKGSVLDNSKFGGIASAAAAAIGAVAQLMVQHRARHDIQVSIEENQKPIEDLINLIANESTLAYERQKSTLSAQSMYLANAYKSEIARPTPDTLKLLNIANQINSIRAQQAALAAANPSDAVTKMSNSFEALVKFVRSDNNPTTLAELIKQVQAFVSAAQPLGQAAQSLISAS